MPEPQNRPSAAPTSKPAGERSERHSDSARPVQATAVKRVVGAIPGLALDEDGNPVFRTDEQLSVFMQRMIDSGYLGGHIKDVPQAIAAMNVCKHAGLPWQVWINKLYFIDNNPAVYTEFLQASAMNTGKVGKLVTDFFDEKGKPRTPENAKGWRVFSCRVTVKRTDQEDEQQFWYTLDDANAAGLIARNKNYAKFAADMLMWRAKGRALKDKFPMCDGGAIVQGFSDFVPLNDDGGRQLSTEDGSLLFQRRQSKAEERQAVALKALRDENETP